MRHQWQPSAIDNDDDHHHDNSTVEHTTTVSDGEEHQPHRGQSVHTTDPCARGAVGSAGSASWHQWRSLDSGCRQIGFVLQDTVLLRGTVSENIAFGRPDATPEQIIRAAERANADEFIGRMPDGFDSMIGDRGATLSGGQRQRIGIARALIRDNPILILDEPTAALDAESEELVIKALKRLMKGRTVITIAHRLSTLRDADKIVVIKDGIVIEKGPHQELRALDGVYAGLHRLQFGEH
jgi:ABC-type multidrug transport system fused ATPase/permease subunit